MIRSAPTTYSGLWLAVAFGTCSLTIITPHRCPISGVARPLDVSLASPQPIRFFDITALQPVGRLALRCSGRSARRWEFTVLVKAEISELGQLCWRRSVVYASFLLKIYLNVDMSREKSRELSRFSEMTNNNTRVTNQCSCFIRLQV